MTTRRSIRTAFLTVFAIVALTATAILPAAAQTPAPAALKSVPLKIDVVLSRWQAEKKVSSLPFALYIVAPAVELGVVRPPQGPSGPMPPFASQSVRMGVDVPVGTSSRTNTNGQGQPSSSSTTTTSPEYRNVGTSIDGRVGQTDDGRFSIYISVQDTSIFTNDGPSSTQIRMADPMAFRTFTMSNTLTMRDGQTLPFAMASDKISGDIIKVDVTVTVLK